MTHGRKEMKWMVIDMHVHPAFIEEIGFSEEKLEYNRQILGLYKTDEFGLNQWRRDCAVSGIDRLCVLPLSLPVEAGGGTITNGQVAELVKLCPDMLIGFASVNPNEQGAVERLEYAFTELGLKGVKLHPSKQKFYPGDSFMEPVYQICEKYNKPIIFHSGVSMEPGTLVKYAHPLEFEEVAYRHPKLRICLAHFGWPWVKEVCMLMLKYPNVYTDTAMLYFDNPKEFYHQCMEVDIGPHWIDRSLRHQVMFGSDDPRLEQRRMICAIREMDMRESTKELILGGNALEFLGGI